MHIEQFIKQREGETLEFKSSFQSDAIETLVAFANTKEVFYILVFMMMDI
jgi:predicted HTH transcriptional regulator